MNFRNPLLQRILRRDRLGFSFQRLSRGCCSVAAGKPSVWREKLVPCISETVTRKAAFVRTVVKYYLYLGCCCRQRDLPLDGAPHQTLNMFPCKHGNNFLALNFTLSFVSKLSILWFAWAKLKSSPVLKLGNPIPATQYLH